MSQILDETIPLTSFLILMAKYKGYLSSAVSGVAAIQNLSNGDTVLRADGCTHHRRRNDIRTVSESFSAFSRIIFVFNYFI